MVSFALQSVNIIQSREDLNSFSWLRLRRAVFFAVKSNLVFPLGSSPFAPFAPFAPFV
jgi:hypothetical protein